MDHMEKSKKQKKRKKKKKKRKKLKSFGWFTGSTREYRSRTNWKKGSVIQREKLEIVVNGTKEICRKRKTNKKIKKKA